ncbi:MAG TPA: type II toxin-antitoxin system RelB/DinJ family antitoxin [Candidatus Contendobacter sp.]|jgi:DNA-damage-inducible protein J|nr:type II toxin-antitoxin system RelB/DinJ family antitoxin [Candidatus Contendobacter sp.]
MATTTMVHVRVDEAVKAKAAATLAAMGLSVSDAVRMLLVRIAAEQALPFDVRAPNAETVAAIQELEAGRGRRFENMDSLLADLNAGD